jgi:hypothetical protein
MAAVTAYPFEGALPPSGRFGAEPAKIEKLFKK